MADDGQIQQRKDYYESGELEAERSVRVLSDGKEVNHGPYVRWYANGVKAEEGAFDNGEKVGLWRSWTSDGRNFFDGTFLPAADGDPAPPDVRPPDFADPPDALPNPTEVERAEVEKTVAQAGKGRLWFETIAVLSLVWGAPLATGLASWIGYDGVDHVQSFSYDATVHLATTVPVWMMLLYVIYRSGEGFKAFGISRPRLIVDIPVGIVLCVVIYAAEIGMLQRYGWLQSSYVPPMPLGLAENLLLFVMYLSNSLSEELGMRAYLMRRFGQLTKSPLAAYFIAAVLFASYHLYQGWVGGLGALIFGLGYGAVYILTRRIWPLLIAHTAHNVLLYNETLSQWFGVSMAR
ncbi:MAG: CPBP family intramembrane metalloprotease [Planctomycetes bacterium]|nr:CPBP family intramembrane metalloprotease [Planctomycetota bacterium]